MTSPDLRPHHQPGHWPGHRPAATQLGLWGHAVAVRDSRPGWSLRDWAVTKMLDVGWEPGDADRWIMGCPQGRREELMLRLVAAPWLAELALQDMSDNFDQVDFLDIRAAPVQDAALRRWVLAGFDPTVLLTIVQCIEATRCHADAATKVTTSLTGGRGVTAVPEGVFQWSRIGLDPESVAILTSVGSRPVPSLAAGSLGLWDEVLGAEFLYGMRHGPSCPRVQAWRDPSCEHGRCGLRFVDTEDYDCIEVLRSMLRV